MLFHSEQAPQPGRAFLLSRLIHPTAPEVMGVLRCVEKPTFDGLEHKQVNDLIAKKGAGDLRKLFGSEETWVVKLAGRRLPRCKDDGRSFSYSMNGRRGSFREFKRVKELIGLFAVEQILIHDRPVLDHVKPVTHE